MLRLHLLAVLAVGLLVGCDSNEPYVECPPGTDCLAPLVDPDTVDFDGVAEIDFERYVRPILAARDALAPTETDMRADPATITYDRVLSAGPSGTVIPFDPDASLLVRLAEEALAPDSDDPLPNLRRLEDDEVRYLRRWIDAGAPDSSGTPAYADAEVLLYVCNQLAGRVSIVDVERERIIRNVYFEDHGQPADARPHHVIATPAGDAWFVALIAGDGGGSVLKFSTDLATDPAEEAYLLASETPPDGDETFQKPGMLAYESATPRLYAGRSFSADPASSGIGQFDASSLAYGVIQTPDVHPHALGVSNDGRFMLTAALTTTNGATDTFVFDAASGDLVDRESIPGALAFVHYAVSPDGETVVLTSQLGGALYVFDFDTDAGDLTLLGSVATGEQPWHPVFSPDGALVYVPNRMTNDIAVVDPSALTLVKTISNPEGGPFSQPHGSAITADGSTLFVSSRNFVMPMMNMGPTASRDERDDVAGHGEMDHSAMNHGDEEAPPAMATPAIRWTPPVRFLTDEGEPESADLYGNVAFIDSETGEIRTVIQTGRWASGLALYDPR